MEQITKEQAIAIYDGGEWKDWTDEDVVRFQLYQDRLALPFSRFQLAMEKVLGRSVWTHEFAFRDGLIAEYEGRRPKPTFGDILALIPKEKRIMLVCSKDADSDNAQHGQPATGE